MYCLIIIFIIIIIMHSLNKTIYIIGWMVDF